jgi:hypothetical protein
MNEDSSVITSRTNKAREVLLGKKIVEVRYLTDKEMKLFDWRERSVVFVLDDGTQCFIASDDEGNGGGSLHCYSSNDEFTILPILS